MDKQDKLIWTTLKIKKETLRYFISICRKNQTYDDLIRQILKDAGYDITKHGKIQIN